MTDPPIIVFVCEHGAAKSVLAAAYFNKLACEKGFSLRAVARGTHPDAALSQKTVAGLLEDGLTPSESTPKNLSPADMESAQRIISFCELPAEYDSDVSVEQWDGVPPVSESYQTARDAILGRLDRLLAELN
jgi:arsenate reductase